MDGSLERRLETPEIVSFPECPFPLPSTEDLRFLCQQRVGGRGHKNISWNPRSSRCQGFRRQSAGQEQRLAAILGELGHAAADWLRAALPRYRGGCELDRVSFRPEEDAIRPMRPSARNDLLHIDAFPTRPARERRLLRLFVNLNPDHPRVWATSESFAELHARFAERVRGVWGGRIRQRLEQIVYPERTHYDRFMLRFHDFLKRCDEFQDRARRRIWKFPPRSAWLAFTDSLSYAELRGRHVIDLSCFIAPEVLAAPELAPFWIIRQADSARPAA